MQQITIETILAGQSPSEYYASQGQFLSSIGIDPEMPKDDTATKPSGILRPTSTEKISGTEVTGTPLWIETTSKNTNAYVYAADGKVHVVASNLTMGTALNGGAALTTAAGNGLAYYNNYLYGASNTDIWRYGPLDGSPSLVQNFWTSTLSLTALANKTYPSINGVTIPNHTMYVHPANNRLYFADVNGSGVGILSMIKTKKVTAEGDTNDTVVPSAYNVLDTYYNWYPTCISHVGTELVVGLIDGTSATNKQKNAQVAFWDTLPSTTSYNRIATLPDPLITAMANVNGVLYVFSGSAAGGMRISRYLGGQSFEELYYADDQYPPVQGAVEYMINRVLWGGSTTSPIAAGSVFALGGRSRAMNMGVHGVMKSSTAGTVTAIKYFTQGATKQPIIGWKGSTTYGIDKPSTTYGTSVWRSQMYRVGRKFNVKSIRIPLATAVAANMSITVKIYTDDGSTATTVGTIDNTNNPGARYVKFWPTLIGTNNFFLELTWTGSALLPVSLPIQISFETLED